MKNLKLFPFTNPKLDHIQRTVVALIENPEYQFELPQLPLQILDNVARNPLEAARLGFAGDAHISSSIATELLCCFPEANPGFYTCTRTVLVANSTFAHLMRKVGLYKPNDPVKAAGDAFEAILAAFYAERGPEEFQAYIKKYFVPLIESAGHAHRNAEMYTSSSIWSTKDRHVLKSQPRHHGNHGKKSKQSSTKKRMISSTPKTVSSKPKAPTHPLRSGNGQVKASEIIDLTLDTNSEEGRTIASMLEMPSREKPQPPSSKTELIVPVKHMIPAGSRSATKGSIPQIQTDLLAPLRRKKVRTHDSDICLSGPSRLLHSTPFSTLKSSVPTYTRAQDDLVSYSQQAGDINDPIILD